MSLTGWLNSAIKRAFRRNELAGEMEDELRAHIALRADDLERTGLSRERAERRARIEFGARERIREESYVAMGAGFLDVLLLDVVSHCACCANRADSPRQRCLRWRWRSGPMPWCSAC